MRGNYVPDWTERGLPEEYVSKCVSCGASEPSLYDERHEHYYCDDDCMLVYLLDNFEDLIDYYKQLNVGVVT